MDSVSAYIPLLTLLQLLDNLKLRYKYKLNYIDQEQIDSLEEKVILFTGFLQSRPEGPHDPQIEPFVLEIYNAVLETCQVLDFHVVDQIRREGDAKEDGGVKWLSAFREDMIKIIRDMELILSKVVGFTFESATLSPESQLPPISADPSSSSSMFKSEDRKVIGFEHHLSWLKDELIASHVKSRKVIPIVGMGGIGKTTLARLVYEDPSIRRRFDKEKLYWVSVSQGYDLLRILQGILNKKDCISIIDLGTELYQKLKGSRYLIVLDDMWDVRAWEDLRQYFPEDNQGSRIIVTTRAKNLADGLADPSSKTYDVGFLNKEKSWELFCDRLFGDKHCPGDLEVFGRQIVENCRGLPLGIITITGLLSKSDMTCKYWSSVSKNVAALVNMEDNEYCRKVLRISYDYLPLYLKPSFLFIGRFYEEDVAISLDQLIRSLVTFAVVSPIPRVPIQQIATYYVRELFQRNLIFIRGSTLGIHDLLRDICLQETSKEKLFARDFAKLDESTKWGMKRICFGIKNKKECTKWILGSKRSFYLVRRVEDIWLCGKCTKEVSHYSAFWNIKDFNNHNDEDNHKGIASEIWNSPQLEYVDFYSVTFPLNERKRPVIFERLQSLTAGVSGWTRDMANTMPNLKDLLLYYHEESTCDVALPHYWRV